MVIFIKKEPRDLTAAFQYYCNQRLDGAHDAEVDTCATKQIFFAQIDRYNDIGTTIEEIADFSTFNKVAFADISGKLRYNEERELIFNFGKYNGQKVIDNPDYCRWILGEDFPEDTKMLIRQSFQHN